MSRVGLLSFLLVVFCSIANANPQTTPLTEAQIHALRLKAVEKINADRAQYQLLPVELDELASRVGDAHCKESVERGVTSHWSLDGRTPYMRYAWAGGHDGLAENLVQLYGRTVEDPSWLLQELDKMEDGFMSEKPPKDGHRQNILTREHTHVGIGLYWSATGLCYTQEFLDRYVSVEPLPVTARLKDKLMIKGKVIYPGYSFYLIDILYEPLPKPMSLIELAETYDYSLPENDEMQLRPKAPGDLVYADGKTGEVTQINNSFQANMVFFKNQPGVYTVVVWVMNGDRRIQATMISIKVTG